MLVDSTGQEIRGVLSNDEGMFSLRAPGPGTYSLRAEHVGYRTTSSPPLQLTAGEDRIYHMVIPFQSIEVSGIRVEAERECVVRPEEGLATARLWEETRKALNAVHWAERGRLFVYEVVRHRRELDPRTLVVMKQEVDTTWRLAVQPFVAASADDLVERGFVQESPADTFYYAPDAEVLLSDAFLDTHCFRVRASGETGLIGLAFEPVPGRAVTDIRGVFWLDEETAAPRFLEYQYTGLRFGFPVERFGGRVEFARLPTGAWIMGSWSIRGPIIGLTAGPRLYPKRREKLVAIKEVGETVIRIRPREKSPATRKLQARAVLEGTVFDSLRMRPLAGAKVYLSGTRYATTTDTLGRYRLEDLPPGTYSLAFYHPRLDTLRYYPAVTELSLAACGEVASDLAVPSLTRVRSDRLIRLWAGVSRVVSPDSLVGTPQAESRVIPSAEATDGDEVERLISQGLLDLRRFELTRRRDPYRRAVDALERAVKGHPKLAWSHYALGMTLARGPEVTLDGAVGYRHRVVQDRSLAEMRARRALLMAVELDPLLEEAALELTSLGLASRNRSTLRQAKDALRRVIKGGRAGAEVWVALADIEAALGDPAAASDAARKALAIEPGHPSALHALADALLLQSGREGPGADAYFEGLERLDEVAAVRYWEDILGVVHGDEEREWRGSGLEERSDWLLRYWEVKAAVAGVTVPERLADHYRRLAAAHERYRRSGSRGAPPPGALLIERKHRRLPFDDRGLILIRHGEPDQVVRTHRPKIPPNETWVYDRSDSRPQLFHFLKLEGRPDFVLSGELPKCDPYYYKYGDSGPRVEQEFMRYPQPFTGWELDPLIDYYEDRATFDHRFQQFIARCLTAVENINRLISDTTRRVTDTGLREPLWQVQLDWNYLSAESRRSARVALTRETYWPDFAEDLPFVQHIYSFRGPQERTELTAALLVPAERLQPETIEGSAVYSLAISFILADTVAERVQRADTIFRYRSDRVLEKGEYVRTHLKLRSEPWDAAIFRISLKDASIPEHGRVVGGPFDVRDYSGRRLALSDVVVAESEEGPWQRGETRLALRPGHNFRVGESLTLFYEIYNLPKGAPYRTEIVVEPEGSGRVWSWVRRFLGVQLPGAVSLEFEGLAAAPSGPGLQELRSVAGSLPPGEYTIRVTVTNLERLESATAETRLTVVE